MDDIQKGAKAICDTFAAAAAPTAPFFIGRNGTIELEVIYFWIMQRGSNIIPRREGDTAYPRYPDNLFYTIQRNAGVFPSTNESLDSWCLAYIQALKELTGTAAGWYKPLAAIEAALLDKYAPPTLFKTPLRSLEPYYVPQEFRWTQYLSGKRVAVVSSFADSIRRQIEGGRLDRVWKGEQAGIIPKDVQWSYIRTGYAPMTALGRAGWPRGVESWSDAVTVAVGGVIASGAEIALVGCGGLGMIIGAELKKRGVSVILLGGAIQVLFGIKGGRWASHDVISKFWNEAWMWPAADEIPGGAQFIEGGCYWGKGT